MDAHGPLTNVRGYDQSLLSSSSRGSTPDLNALQMTLDETFEDYQTEIEQYRELYAAAIEYVSRQVAEFCKSVDDDTAVIITSDHGEQLVDDGREKRFGHVTPDMTEPLLHVPLEIVNADISVDETEIISHLDLGRIITAISNGESFENSVPLLQKLQVSVLRIRRRITNTSTTGIEYRGVSMITLENTSGIRSDQQIL